ncbi:BlaI/MecI/CopY family transcriptional regulator [Streptomyces tsukubensis]|uniref:BlaI/MecI/CopY family transcriptional regulator n=1 Tax=Streptomyces tsukubensis TaxID=83656 RepID=UPI00368E306E
MKGQLGELEDAVMTRVWRLDRPVTVREVLLELRRERTIAYTTVMTVMDKVHRKGLLRRELDGRAYRYTAVATRAEYAAGLMNEAWSHGDCPTRALVAFVGTMSPEQRAALDEALRILDARGGPPQAPT